MMNRIILLLAVYVAWLMGLGSLFAQIGRPGLWISALVLPVGISIARLGGAGARDQTDRLRLVFLAALFAAQCAALVGWPDRPEYWGYFYCVGWVAVLAEACRLIHLKSRSGRMLTAGLVLVLWAGVNIHGVLAFSGQSLIEEYAGRRREAFNAFTAYQMACSRAGAIMPVETFLLRERGRELILEPILMVGYALDLKTSETDNGFTACLRPVRPPRFPYNLVFRLPFYRSDSSGIIRSDRVDRPLPDCPSGGREIQRVDEAAVKQAMEKYLREYR